MGRPKGAHKKPDKEEQDERQTAIIEAVQAKRQACWDALDESLPFRALNILQELAAHPHPSRLSSPLAQASKLAAQCAIRLYLRQKDYNVAEAQLQKLVLRMINDAVHWAWEGATRLDMRPACLISQPCTSAHTCGTANCRSWSLPR